jgi:hypothetical protein
MRPSGTRGGERLSTAAPALFSFLTAHLSIISKFYIMKHKTNVGRWGISSPSGSLTLAQQTDDDQDGRTSR